jgi:hypothetical protein
MEKQNAEPVFSVKPLIEYTRKNPKAGEILLKVLRDMDEKYKGKPAE